MNRRKGWGGYQHMVKSRPTHYTYTKMWGKLKYITHWTWCHQPAYMLIHELSNTKTKHHPTRTFPNQRRHFATELHGKFLQSILCRTKNGEIVHLLRRKNVPWCAEAKRLQFLFLRFVCCWQRENMENSVSCVGYVNIYDYGLVPEKPSVSTYQWVKYPNFTENQPFFICPKRKYQPQTEGICYLTNYCVTFTPPVKTKQRAAQKIRQKQSQGPSPTTHVPRACASVLQRKSMFFVL